MTSVTIVAVHGLNGDRLQSFTRESPSGLKTMWLRDLLPGKLPHARARVLTFGYAASLANNTSVAGVRGTARRLLSLLSDNRRSNQGGGGQGGTIIFVVHSLGGIVVKQVGTFK